MEGCPVALVLLHPTTLLPVKYPLSKLRNFYLQRELKQQVGLAHQYGMEMILILQQLLKKLVIAAKRMFDWIPLQLILCCHDIL